MSVNMEEQYDKIYRYCYFKLHHQQTAEDITQETFLRYFQKYGYSLGMGKAALQCLYTIARNLCIDEYRRQSKQRMHESVQGDSVRGNLLQGNFVQDNFVQADYMPENFKEEQILTGVVIRGALSELKANEQELLLLRYVNEVPVAVIGQMLGISRFAVRRRLLAVQRKFRNILEKTGGI